MNFIKNIFNKFLEAIEYVLGTIAEILIVASGPILFIALAFFIMWVFLVILL